MCNKRISVFQKGFQAHHTTNWLKSHLNDFKTRWRVESVLNLFGLLRNNSLETRRTSVLFQERSKSSNFGVTERVYSLMALVSVKHSKALRKPEITGYKKIDISSQRKAIIKLRILRKASFDFRLYSFGIQRVFRNTMWFRWKERDSFAASGTCL